MSLRRLLSEPLLQFTVVGGVLFGAYRAVERRSPDRIVIHEDAVEARVNELERRGGKEASEVERAAIVQELVDQEILIAEAQALGLHRADPVVRRRLAQKMRFVLEDQVPPPTDEELRAWVRDHAERYARGERRTFEHRFFSGSSGQERAEQAVSQWGQGTPLLSGDAFVHGGPRDALTQAAIGARFGDAFAQSVMQLPVGRWSVLQSSAGWHAVRVEAVLEPSLPSLDEIRATAQADWRQFQEQARLRSGLDALRERYDVQLRGGER